MSWPAAVPGSVRSAAAVGRQAQRTVFCFGDEGEDFRDRRILRCHRLHRLEAFGEDAWAVKQLLIESAHGGEALLGELAALHADDVEALERGILAVDHTERDDVAAHAADAADHHLRPDPGELVHRRQPADIDEITDLAVAAERR